MVMVTSTLLSLVLVALVRGGHVVFDECHIAADITVVAILVIEDVVG